MIGALIALLSLDMTRKLVAAGSIAKTLTIVAATNATPIVITTSSAHGFVRPVHAVVASVGGNTAANGVWVLTPVTSTTLTLSKYTSAGTPQNSTGDGVYTSGGTAKIGFPDGSILLGRRAIMLQTAVATPRIVFVPVGSPQWEIDPYGGVIPAASLPKSRDNQTDEQQFMILRRQLTTEKQRFEVHVTGCASPPDPEFGDFDATQAIYHSLYSTMFDMIGPDRARVLGGDWASQDPSMQQIDVRGQKWIGSVEIAQPVVDNTLEFIPTSTDATIAINLVNGSSADDTIVQIPSV